MSMTIQHNLHTVETVFEEEVGIVPDDWPGEIQADWVVAYRSEGDIRTRANMHRMVHELHGELGPAGYGQFEIDVGGVGAIITCLAIPDDVLSLMIVYQLLKRIDATGWVDDEDWDTNMEAVRDEYWLHLMPADRARIVLTHGGDPADILRDEPPSHSIVQHWLDIEAARSE